MKSRTARMVAGVVAIGLLVAACGGDDDDDATGQEAVVEEGAGGADEAASTADIVETAVDAGTFTTLVAAVQAAGLDMTLQGDGPFTVFAPADPAFAKLPAGTVESLLRDPKGDLTDILSYHVVQGRVLAKDVAGLDGQTVETVNGATFTVDVGAGGSVTLTDAAGNAVKVTQTDIEASNGVIHVIDSVLMPG